MASFFSFRKPPGSSSITPAAPIIRREIRTVAKPKSQVSPVKPSSNGRSIPQTSRITASTQTPKKTLQRKADNSRVTAVRAGTKRKSSSPSIQLFDSSSSASESGDGGLKSNARKRTKTGTALKPLFMRCIRDVKNWEKQRPGPSKFVQGIDLTSGEHAKGYKAAFGICEESLEVELQYPSPGQVERFQLVSPLESDGFKPLDEIHQTIIQILTHYLPPKLAEPLLSPSDGIPFLLTRAFNHRDLPAFLATLNHFNNTIRKHLPEIATHLDTHPSPPLPLISHILSQIYARTVSPRVELLRRYTAGSSNVYGELLPPFINQIFVDTALRPTDLFLDLGSGVGNVALQAALQVGCDAHGVEVMQHPCELAALQAAEFPARARAWGLSVGKCALWQGDFRADAQAVKLLQSADVVLVNNQAFTPALNEALTALFLELKEGARVVSLKSFVPAGWKLSARTSGSVIAMLEVKRKEFWSGCVSWKDDGGEYFVATKDTGRVARFLKGRGTGAR